MGAHMRKLVVKVLAAASLTLAVAGIAAAADMPTKAPAAPVVAPVNWTGFYVGLNAGYGWGKTDHTNTTSGVTTGDFDIKGGVVGLTYGFNWQISRVVLGFEGDFDYAHINGTGGLAVCGAGCFTLTKWISTDRARVGWDFNGLLVYGTGGVAFADVQSGLVPCTNGLTCISKDVTGWTVGGGIEAMFYRNWSAKIEYLHYDFGTKAGWQAAGPSTVTALDRGNIVRAGINYHFNPFVPARLN